ncbi:helicase [Amycolatopsis sp. TNS106]|nr:helicase [Amycolatopsis sp. TNS106]
MPQAPALQPHQQQIHDFIVDRPFAGAWVNIGGGKTLATLRVLQTVRPIGHILLIAPVAIARSTWLDEIEKWGFPIRTKSLIVDDLDRKISRQQRLERFREIFTDQPTMYFVNQEILTQPSQRTSVLKAVLDRTSGPMLPPDVLGTLSPEALDVLDFLRTRGPEPQDDVVVNCREEAARSGRPVPSKAAITTAIRELLAAKAVARERRPCPTCSGQGCSECRFGLVDQMPVHELNGQRTITWPFPTVIIDESQGFKSHASDRFTALAQVRPAINRLIELTGTPSPNGLHDLWSQVYLLDEGASLGRTITDFRRRWFIPKMVPGTTTPAKWIPKDDAEEEIHQAISHLVMSAENTSLVLPPVSIQDVNVTLPADLLQTYKEFRRDLVMDVVKTYRDADGALTHSLESIVADNQAVLTSKLMQFASGTLYTADPDQPSSKGDYTVIHDKKLEMAEYLVRNNGGQPMLIAYQFRSDRERLLAHFVKTGVGAEAFDGSRHMVHRWNAQQIPVMLLHPASAGHGLNLQYGGSSLIWYTLPFSLEHYLQTNGRLPRPGQTRPVVIHRLIAKGTQDERMPRLLAEKQLVQDNLLDAVSGDAICAAALEAEIREDLNDLWLSERV